MNEIENFINNFKSMHSVELEEVFIHRNCYWFASILHQHYYETIIMYEPTENHFLIMDEDGQLYDIRGNVTDKYCTDNLYPWDNYWEFDELDYERVKHYCIDLR